MSDSVIYTLGTDLRTWEDFIEILLAYEIKAYIDVRSIPRSRIPAYSKRNLARELNNNGIEYHFFGPELGGLRKGGYTAYIITQDFLDGLARLEEIARNRVSVVACAERFPWKCHRKWISRELQKRGWMVEHIIDKGKLWIPK